MKITATSVNITFLLQAEIFNNYINLLKKVNMTLQFMDDCHKYYCSAMSVTLHAAIAYSASIKHTMS